MSSRFTPLAACWAGRLAAGLGLAVAATGQDVVINEFSYDDSGTDDYEFVELYNAGSSPVDISNWTLESNDENGPNTTYTVSAGTTLQPGAFYVMGSGLVANVNQVIGATDIFENSMESLELRDTGGTLVDAVVYEVNKASWVLTPDLLAQCGGDGIWGNAIRLDASICSWQRNRDGYDTNVNGRDFRHVFETPGASNDLPVLTPLVENFDTLTVDQPVPNWAFSFVAPVAVDPTRISSNPNPIAASPQGGNALLCWDPAGGGNAACFLGDADENSIAEFYLYLDANPEPAGEYEVFSIGLQGTATTFFNSPDPSGTRGFLANGNTGVSLIYFNDDVAGTLYLVDHGDGGWGSGAATPARVLGEITIVPGVNDGWQRIRLQAGSGHAELRFGGTFGAADGTSIHGRTEFGGAGGFYVAYREFVTDNGSVRPPTMDFLVLRSGSADVSYEGTGSQNTVGEPTLAATTFPDVGNAGFGFDVSNLSSNGPSFGLVGFQLSSPPLDLSLIGAPAGAMSYFQAQLTVGLTVGSGGTASFPLPVPNDPSLSGGSLFVQVLDTDFGLRPARLPLATSGFVRVTVGT